MKKNRVSRNRLLALALVGLLCGSAIQAAENRSSNKNSLGEMTVNLYLGGDSGRVVALDPSAPDYLPNLVATVTEVVYDIYGSQPVTRLNGVADQIVSRNPEIISVEEASLIRLQSPGDLVLGGSVPATNVVFDYLQILVDALSARGAHYAIAASINEVDVEMPMLNLQTGGIDDVRLTDRDAILVRTDLPPGQLRVSHPRSGNFTNIIRVPAIGLAIERGWCSVDVFHRGQVFRYICAHLEEETAPQLQVLEAQELLGGPAKTTLPVMIAGDFNADVLHRDGSTAYDTFIQAGFKDSWAVVHPADVAGGLTWGHDELLADPNTQFDRRIDMVFFRGRSLVPVQAQVTDMVLNRIEAPFWASDHASLWVGFKH